MLWGAALVIGGCSTGHGDGGPGAPVPASVGTPSGAAGGAGTDDAGAGLPDAGTAGTPGGPAPCAAAAISCAGTMLGPWCVDQFLVGDPGSPGLTGLWASGPSDVWAVGSRVDASGIADAGGFAFHWDGCSWTQASIQIATGLRHVWGATPNDVWAVGDHGTALHFDGRAWTAVDVGTTSDLWSISGTAGNDVWTIGGAGVLHWDGAAWTPSPGYPAPGSDQTGGGIWAVTPADVWVVGSGNLVVHFDGAGWTASPAASDAAHALSGVWSDGATTWAVGEGSPIQKLTAGNWTAIDGGDGGFRSVMGAGSDVWAVGASVVHSSGGPFPVDRHLPSPDFELSGLWLTPTQVWASGTGPTAAAASRLAVVVHRSR